MAPSSSPPPAGGHHVPLPSEIRAPRKTPPSEETSAGGLVLDRNAETLCAALIGRLDRRGRLPRATRRTAHEGPVQLPGRAHTAHRRPGRHHSRLVGGALPEWRIFRPRTEQSPVVSIETMRSVVADYSGIRLACRGLSRILKRRHYGRRTSSSAVVAHSGFPVCIQSSPDLLDVNTFVPPNFA